MSDGTGNFDKKASEGKKQFERRGGDMQSVKAEIDSMIDGMLSSDTLEGEDDAADASDAKPQSRLRWLYILVGLIGLLLIVYMGYRDGSASRNAGDEESVEVLFAQYFELMPDATTHLTRGDEVGSPDGATIDTGMAAYRAGSYAKASDMLLSIDEVDAQFYGTVSVLGAGDAELARTLFDAQLQNPEYVRYHDAIQWYTALCAIKLGDTQSAKDHLHTIASNSKHYKSEVAQQILKRL